jgi:NAD(P)-dependent dehydrogenase (short-subunit alcohol dehydrogenase family)
MSKTSNIGSKAMNPIYDFKGQVALVTGTAKGMRLSTARMFAASGASVVLADLDGDLAGKEAERIVREGGTAIGITCDVADEAQVAAMVDHAVAEYGRLDMALTMPASRCRHRTPPRSRSSISSASPR